MSRRRQREGAGPKPAPWRAEKAAMDMVMGGAITAVAATTTVGIGATNMAGGIIAIGDDFYLRPKKGICIWPNGDLRRCLLFTRC